MSVDTIRYLENAIIEYYPIKRSIKQNVPLNRTFDKKGTVNVTYKLESVLSEIKLNDQELLELKIELSSRQDAFTSVQVKIYIIGQLKNTYFSIS